SRPVPLLFGDLPAWRRLAVGVSDGADVRQLEANLVALGYANESQLKVDDHFNSATAAAVRRWQKALAVDQTGAVELGEAVFLPGKVRVAERTVAQGDSAAPGAPVLKVTSTNRQVRVELDAAKQSTVKVGDEVEVKLPSGQMTKGSVTSVGTVATTKGSPPNTRSVIEVLVTLHDPAAAGSVDEAPVRVGFVSGSRNGVLAVPVSALLALREGGYGVRVVEGASSRIVPVTTGLFAKGMVEVSGEGLREGQQVEVPAS
ncbi:MAG TPA: peptidoglycan-binding protein, partial [Acidimicrobiales bacterium]|nr:peptidoglycan-binding protein [Acidimicrobiales bacterium]